ncbi:MAG: hypothetical protein ACUVWP_01080 [bacterium]
MISKIKIMILLIGISYFSQASWNIKNVDTNGDTGYCTDIDLDSNGYPHILYTKLVGFHGDGRSLLYAYWDGSDWNFETIVDGSDETESLTNPHCSFGL